VKWFVGSQYGTRTGYEFGRIVYKMIEFIGVREGKLTKINPPMQKWQWASPKSVRRVENGDV
jgi:hypothetical protein